MASRRVSAAFFLVVPLLLAGCGTLPGGGAPDSSSTSTSGSAAPAPRYNLTGYSAAFKAGYVDACATLPRRNAGRFKTDADYSMGWNDGQSACRAR